MMRRQMVVCSSFVTAHQERGVQLRFGSSNDTSSTIISATQTLQRDLLQRSKLSAAAASPPDLGTDAPKKATLRPFVPVKHVLFGEVETTVCGGIDGIVNASIDAMIAAGNGGTVSEKVLLWIATFLSARPSHQQHSATDATVMPLVTVLCELEKDVYSSAREHKKSSIYKASKDKAATTMDNARAIHHALDHAVQTHFLELQASSSSVSGGGEEDDKSKRIELARKLIVNVLLPLYEARLLALSNDFVGFVDTFDKVAKSIDEVLLEAHVMEVLGNVSGSTPLINLFIDNTVRNSSTIISNSVMMAPEYFNKSSRLKIPADDSVAITLTPIAAAAKAAILAPATNILLVLYADKQNINHNIKGILSKHKQLKEQVSSSQKSASSSSGGPKGPTLSVSAANAPTFKMPSWASSSPSASTGPATPPPANLSPETVLKVASSTQILPHTLTRSTVDRESIQLLNALEYPHPIADDEDATDMHGNKAPKLTPEDKKRRQLEIAEQNKFLQHAPSLAVLQSVVAKAYGANNYTFGTSHKTHYIMTVVVPMALRFIKGDLPFLMATMAEEAKAAKAGVAKPEEKKKDANPDLTDLVGAPNFPHFMDMRHSAAGTSPWHPAFSVFARRPASFNHHPTQASAVGFSAVSKDDFGFLVGLLIPMTVGFFLGVYIIMKLGKGIYWAVQWLIDEAGSYGLAPTSKKPINDASSSASDKTGVSSSASSPSPTSGITISASAMSAAFDKDEPKK